MDVLSFCVNTNCCAVQRNETYRIAKFFTLNGWTEVSDICMADVNLITTCGVTEDTECESLVIIDSVYEQKKTGSRVVISGCLPNISIDILIHRYHDAIYIPFDRLVGFDDLIAANISINEVHYNAEPEFHHSSGDPRLTEEKYLMDEVFAKVLDEKYETDKFFEAYKYNTQGKYLWKDNRIFEIKISSGCKNECSYCASRFGIGKYRSKKKNVVLREFEEGIEKGYKKFMLMGDELGAYGEDVSSSLVELVRDMLAIYPDAEIGIRYIYPDFLINMFHELEEYMNNIFFICISIQSASPNVLAKMNRKDIINPLRNLIKHIKENYRNIFLHTQIIVGFPNETMEDFEDTVRFLEDCCFDYIRYNVFSKRPGTEAAKLDIMYDEESLKVRLKKMKKFCQINRQANLYKRYRNIIEQIKMGE